MYIVAFFQQRSYINIIKYQVYPAFATTHCPSDIVDAHKKKNYKKEKKSRYSDIFLETTILTPAREHQKSSFSNSDSSKKEMVHKHHHRPVINLRFSPWRRSSLTKNNAFNKAIAR
jgi:hypothetical protein